MIFSSQEQEWFSPEKPRRRFELNWNKLICIFEWSVALIFDLSPAQLCRSAQIGASASALLAFQQAASYRQHWFFEWAETLNLKSIQFRFTSKQKESSVFAPKYHSSSDLTKGSASIVSIEQLLCGILVGQTLTTSKISIGNPTDTVA